MDLNPRNCACTGAQKKKSMSIAVPKKNVAERDVLVKCTMVCLVCVFWVLMDSVFAENTNNAAKLHFFFESRKRLKKKNVNFFENV